MSRRDIDCGRSHTLGLKLEQLLSSKLKWVRQNWNLLWKWVKQNFTFIFQILPSDIIIVTSTTFSAEKFHFSSLLWDYEKTCWIKMEQPCFSPRKIQWIIFDSYTLLMIIFNENQEHDGSSSAALRKELLEKAAFQSVEENSVWEIFTLPSPSIILGLVHYHSSQYPVGKIQDK